MTWFIFLGLCIGASGRGLRVATWNVEHGIGEPGTAKHAAQRAILQRLDADVIGFQELNGRTHAHWDQLGAELGYAHRAWGELGPFAGGMYVGYYSRYPIIGQASVGSPPEALELSRIPLRVAIDVPGRETPLVLWNMHHKAMFAYRDRYRRAVEARRILDDLAAYQAAHAPHGYFIILGDMNDDPKRETQPATVHWQPEDLPRTFAPGADVRAGPLTYRAFPTDHYADPRFGLIEAPAFRQGSTNDITHLYTEYRLDYLYLSPALAKIAVPALEGEIYHSAHDRPTGGRPKQGAPLSPGTSLEASDHYPVFIDLDLLPTSADSP
ncbi:MAG: endonuclease/exonuclease/phosphatase family protein [Candidatus Marinimicrobia bacterium]|nr:endonuclease/exonuclease/phosphatase family protein [Candidatus Neomarinimicrobiota bacterium]